ncbi:hypothetical protein MUP05_05780, partial [Candidatus Bathyarchaeota archaeon]|nr:hypothetical protein [Candidatus Bathyarchaeota archaeon]
MKTTRKALVPFLMALILFYFLSSAVVEESLGTTLNTKTNLFNEFETSPTDLNQTLAITVNTSKTLYNVGEEVETNG